MTDEVATIEDVESEEYQPLTDELTPAERLALIDPVPGTCSICGELCLGEMVLFNHEERCRRRALEEAERRPPSLDKDE